MGKVRLPAVTYSFDVDLESVEGVPASRSDVLTVELDSLLLEEVLNGRLGHLAVVGGSVDLDAPCHVDHVVLGACDLFFWQLTHTLDQLFISALEHDHAARENACVLLVLVERGVLTFRKLFLLILNRLPFLIILNHLL